MWRLAKFDFYRTGKPATRETGKMWSIPSHFALRHVLGKRKYPLLSHLLQRLQTDNTSGATVLLDLAIEILETFAEHAPSADPEDFIQDLEKWVGALIATQPSMAVMINLAQHVLQACAGGPPPADAQQQLRQAVMAFRQQAQQGLATLCQQALRVLPTQATILTYSNSATVIAALHMAQAHGRVRRVILSESRPAYDGRLQARTLLECGIAVEYSIDMALFARLPEAHVVLVGADAVFPHGLVNKLGTHALAQLAGRHGIPIFSLCTSNKYLPAAASSLFHIAAHDAAEVWPDAPGGLEVRNVYFDTTPLPLFTGIISEREVHTPVALCQELEQQQLAPALLRMVSG
jgi:translation initiation factor 2B subunit (eIF-2B alpha/beta/delta family)